MTDLGYQRFHEFVQRSIVSERTVRVKLWSTNGTVIYSDDPAGVGSTFPDNDGFHRALRGERVGRIQRPEKLEPVLERDLGTLVEVYTPIVFPGTARPQGVLEIYQYYGPTAKRVSDAQRWIVGSIGLGFAVLYGGLVWIVWRGSRTIGRQHRALVETNAALGAANQELHSARDRLAVALSEVATRADRLWALDARLYAQLKDMTILEERERIAREMHDGLAQRLAYLHLKIGELQMAIASGPDPLLQEELLLRIKGVAAGAYGELRHAIFGLKGMVSRGLGLIPTLTEYLHEFSRETGITVELKVADESATRLSAHAEVQLIRMIQEALANVRKHACARRAWVIFDTEGGQAKITVQDDGRGFDPRKVAEPAEASFGLRSMRERAELAGGMLAVESGEGRGTRVTVRLPIEKEEATSWTR